MTFWNWGNTTIWHKIECVAFYFFKITPPTVQGTGAMEPYDWLFKAYNTCCSQRSYILIEA